MRLAAGLGWGKLQSFPRPLAGEGREGRGKKKVDVNFIDGRGERPGKGRTWRGREGWKGEGRVRVCKGVEETEGGKGRAGSTWIFVQGPNSS